MSSTIDSINIKLRSIDNQLKKVNQMLSILNEDEDVCLLSTMQLVGYHTTDGVNLQKGKCYGKAKRPAKVSIKSGLKTEEVKLTFGLEALAAYQKILNYGKEKYQRELSLMSDTDFRDKEAEHDKTAAEQLTMSLGDINPSNSFIQNY